MNRARIRRRREAGITRFDIITGVGSLLLLVLVAGVPGTAAAPEVALGHTTARVRDAFELARGLSLAAGAPFGVAVDLDGDRLAIIDQRGRIADVPAGLESLVELSSGGVDVTQADFGQGGRTAIFDGQGVPLAGGRLTLQVETNDGVRELFLGFDPATGWLDRVVE